MSVKTFTEEFKIEAVKQITEQGYPVSEVSSRLGVSTNRGSTPEPPKFPLPHLQPGNQCIQVNN